MNTVLGKIWILSSVYVFVKIPFIKFKKIPPLPADNTLVDSQLSSPGSAESPAHCCSSGSESSIDKSETVTENSWFKWDFPSLSHLHFQIKAFSFA